MVRDGRKKVLIVYNNDYSLTTDIYFYKTSSTSSPNLLALALNYTLSDIGIKTPCLTSE